MDILTHYIGLVSDVRAYTIRITLVENEKVEVGIGYVGTGPET